MRTLRPALIVGCIAVAVLSVLYCLPRHPSAGHATLLDVLAHVALFAGIGLWFARSAGRGWAVWLPLAALAAALEVIQWQLGGYPRLEWRDLLSNEAGLALAWWWSAARPSPSH